MRVHLYLNGLAAVRFGVDPPLVQRPGRQALNPPHGAKEMHQGRHRVRAHIQQRTAARLIEEGGIGVPGLRAPADNICRGGKGLSNPALVDELAAGLQGRSEEGVRRAGHAQTLLLGERQRLLRALQRQRQRFFTVDMLARLERLAVSSSCAAGTVRFTTMSTSGSASSSSGVQASGTPNFSAVSRARSGTRSAHATTSTWRR